MAAEYIRDKDIILFIGETGAGKSTLIHFLAGSKLELKYVNGLKHIEPIQIENPTLKDVKTSPFAVSETRFITSVQIKL